MPAIKVRATAMGHYGGHLIPPGKVFFLVDIKDKNGKILHKAEDALALEGKVLGGWMERVTSKVTTETPAEIEARETREAQAEADRQALIAAGIDPDDPEAQEKMAAAALDSGKPKQGMSAPAPVGSNAGDNGKGVSQSDQEVL